MSKGRYERKKSKKVPVWAIIVAILAVVSAVVIAIILLDGQSNDQSPSDPHSVIQNSTDIPGVSNELTEPVETNAPVIPETTSPEEIVSNTDPTDVSQETEVTTEVIVPPPTVVIVERADAEYEKWLSAAMVVCVSIEYPDFELEGIYAASATALEDKFSSDGAYIVFSSGGNRMVIQAKALEGERTDPGTLDISTEVIGFASFDIVDPDSVDLAAMEELSLDELSELIEQSLLISIYSR